MGNIHSIKIFDLSGYLVKEFRESSEHIIWDGNDNYGIKVPPGVYIIKFIGLENVSTLKSLIVW